MSPLKYRIRDQICIEQCSSNNIFICSNMKSRFQNYFEYFKYDLFKRRAQHLPSSYSERTRREKEKPKNILQIVERSESGYCISYSIILSLGFHSKRSHARAHISYTHTKNIESPSHYGNMR